VILKKLTISNFRQYLGKQEIIFAHTKSKNVTIIHGENGFGKTCFLNALLWGFYGADGLTADLPKPEHILPDTFRSNPGQPKIVEASIEILFKHGDDEYTLTRSISLAKEIESRGENTDLALAIIRQDGQTHNKAGREAQKIIDSMLPRDLRELVFFNGERIDHLSMEKNAVQVRDAVRGMLGLKLIEDAIDDLKSQHVRGKLLAELKNHGDQTTQILIDEEAEKSLLLKSKRDALVAVKDNLDANRHKMAAIASRLEENREAHQLQKRREELESELAEKQKSIQALELELSQTLGTDGYMLFCEDLVKKGEKIISDLRAERRIPARVMNDFIHDLFKAGECLCGTCLVEGTDAWKNVERYLTKAGDPEFNRAVNDLDKALLVIKVSSEKTRETVRRLIAERNLCIPRIAKIKEDLEDIKEALSSKDDQQVHQLEAEREALELRKQELCVEQGRLETEIEGLETRLQDLKRQLQAHNLKAEAAQKAQRRVNRLEEAVTLLSEILRLESNDLRSELDIEIQRIFRKISVHDYKLELTPDFTLRLTKPTFDKSGARIDVAHSTGQRQVMSLVFIASLVALAQRRGEIATIMQGLQGGDFPLVMDSPFGQLGNDFRAAIAREVPDLAPQLIVLVSSSQYKGEVEQELGKSSKVGRRYYLRYNAPEKRADASDSIKIGDQQLTIFEKSDTEYTTICDTDQL